MLHNIGKVAEQMEYTINRYTNIMKLNMNSNPVIYFYRKPTIQHCKVTFADGSTYWEMMITDDKTKSIKVEQNKLYLDEACTKLANVTRKQKIQGCKRMGLI